MPAATEGMITDCRPSLRCSRTTAERTLLPFAAVAPMAALDERAGSQTVVIASNRNVWVLARQNACAENFRSTSSKYVYGEARRALFRARCVLTATSVTAIAAPAASNVVPVKPVK